MSITEFSNAGEQRFWAGTEQSLAPRRSRIRHWLALIADASMALKRSGKAALPCQTTSKASARSPLLPLRVVRESDPAVSPDCAGRMVISGRMADVCAELDRMALRVARARKPSVGQS